MVGTLCFVLDRTKSQKQITGFSALLASGVSRRLAHEQLQTNLAPLSCFRFVVAGVYRVPVYFKTVSTGRLMNTRCIDVSLLVQTPFPSLAEHVFSVASIRAFSQYAMPRQDMGQQKTDLIQQ